MKEKIFQLLKQGYSHLGLGDEVLMLHAETIDGLGIVTDDNVESIVSQQKKFLEGLQRANDKRASDATKKTTEELTKKHEEEMKKKAEEEAKRKAEEEAAKKAAEEEAKRKAEEEAAKQAAEEAERKRKEELEKNKEVPDSVKQLIEQMRAESKQREEDFKAQLKALTDANNESKKTYEEQLKKAFEEQKSLKDSYDTLNKEREAQKQAEAKRQRNEMIFSKAKELGIPQYRIDEGFMIAEDADETTIDTYLGNVAKNINAAALPTHSNGYFQRQTAEVKATKEEMDAVAKAMVK